MMELNRMKKTIALLVMVLFIVSLTTVALGAPTKTAPIKNQHAIGDYGPDPNWNTAQLNAYYAAYNNVNTQDQGEQAGITDGYNQGQSDCNNDEHNNNPRANHILPQSASPAGYGKADGYNHAYDRGWKGPDGYDKGYNSC